jgi:hypothetical protein
VDWNNIYRTGADINKYLSMRGRNILFLSRISDALQLDVFERSHDLKDYKAAFTADAVRRIHEAVMEVWPPHCDITSILKGVSDDVTGLYIGDYGLDYLYQGLVRHSIYANKILVVDPFIYPRSVRDEFNPILQPEQYRAQTLRNVNFWTALAPWIDAGIVEIIRDPADFDRKLRRESLISQRKKFDENPALKKAIETTVTDTRQRFEKEGFRLILSAPDSYLREEFERMGPDRDGLSVDDLMAYVNAMREDDPDFLEPAGIGKEKAQLHVYSSGTSYDIAKLTADLTGSYLVTDLYSKWKEIEIDRESHSVINKAWAPFAKAVQSVSLKYLNGLRLEHALTLRKEGRLESLRSLLRRVWKDACTNDPFDEVNANFFADELIEEVKKAEEEWKQIDRDLIKIVGTELGAGLLSAGPLIVSGHAGFLAAASMVGLGAAVVSSTSQRRGFPDKFPASFFMKIK